MLRDERAPRKMTEAIVQRAAWCDGGAFSRGRRPRHGRPAKKHLSRFAQGNFNGHRLFPGKHRPAEQHLARGYLDLGTSEQVEDRGKRELAEVLAIMLSE